MSYEGVGFRFVVRDVLTSAVPQEEQSQVRALSAVTLSRLVGAEGDGEFWCAQLDAPVRRRISDVDAARYDTGLASVDSDGLFTWAHYVALRPHRVGVFGPDCQGVAADLAYVVDVSLGADAVFESSKVDWVATVIIAGRTVADQNRDLERENRDMILSSETEPPPVGEKSLPEASSRARQGRRVSAEDLSRALDGVIATLADLIGTSASGIPRPVEVKARKHSRHRGPGPSYSWDGREVRYHTVDPLDGQVWWSTTDPDEALYWMVDDVTRSAALSWARRTPSSRTMNDGQVRWVLATPMWLTLMTALDPGWSSRTRDRIAELRRHAQQADDHSVGIGRRTLG